MKLFTIIVNTFFLTLLAGVALLFLLPLLPIEQSLEMRIVESGSMEPFIKTGSLVIILPKESYTVGDVITFDSTSADVPTTHRIVDTYTENDRTWFITKGDANEEADTIAIASGDIIGTVRLSVPRAGYVLDFARTQTGFILLIVLPSLLLIISEIEKIWREIKRRKPPLTPDGDSNEIKSISINSKNSSVIKNRLMVDIATPIKLPFYPTLDLTKVVKLDLDNGNFIHLLTPVSATVVICGIIIGSGFLGSTVSYYNEKEYSTNNLLQAIELDFKVFPDGLSFVFDNKGKLIDDIDGSIVTLVVSTDDSVDTLYDISTDFKGGNPLLCDAIIADSAIPFAYNAPLSSLSAIDVEFLMPWSLAFSLPNNAGLSYGDTCVLDIVLTAWHFEEVSNQGYFDEERIPLSFALIPPSESRIFIDSHEESLLLGSTTIASTTDKDKNNNGHGNDEDQNDDSNPGHSNDTEDFTDDESSIDESGMSSAFEDGNNEIIDEDDTKLDTAREKSVETEDDSIVPVDLVETQEVSTI